MNPKKEAEKVYNKLAKVYHKRRLEIKTFNELLEKPITFSLLGNVKDKKVLDAGCGSGIRAKILAKKGARVTGIDISSEMLSLAKKHCKGLKIQFDRGSIDNLPYKNNSFDIIAASLVIHYLKNPNKAFKEFYRVLKKGGILVFSTDSPCRGELIKHKKKWGFIITDYFKKKKTYWKLHGSNVKIPNYSSTLGDIMKYILHNKFGIEDFREARLPKKAKDLLPKKEFYYQFKDIPTFIAFKCKKI